jgi:hypothetical protein|tara:strand:- start:1709 stop:1891 length:183 start_codon:yes stop_codon:yes gene_type:complete
MDMPYYFDEFATEDIQMWVRECGKDIPKAKLRGDLDDVKTLENIVRSGSKELLRRWRDGE